MSKLVASRNQAFFYRCPACNVRVPARGQLWLWFEGRQWLHPDCWKERLASKQREQAEQDAITVTVTLHDTDFEWEAAAGPSA